MVNVGAMAIGGALSPQAGRHLAHPMSCYADNFLKIAPCGTRCVVSSYCTVAAAQHSVVRLFST